jgi:sigma-B regulation protein RsbU (phosphoserine phosphatase)
MLRSIRRQQNELLEKERMERELKIAQEIQQSLLPSSVPDFPGCTFASYFQPHSEASGDYFDFIPIDGENIGIVIADVSGHGVGASLVMVMTRTILRSLARKETNPVKVMKLMNPSIHEDTLSTMFVTMFYGVLNARKKVLSYATAGHNRGMLYNRKERRITMLKPGGVPLGAVVSETFDEHVKGYQLTLSPGDIFLQYTDGVVEARNPRGDEFGDENLLEAVKNSAAKSSRELIDAVTKTLKSFVGSAKSHDDITLIAFSMD